MILEHIKSVFFQFSATRSKSFPQLHCANSPVLSHGPKGGVYLLLVVDENKG
jgi:hypothetical protein